MPKKKAESSAKRITFEQAKKLYKDEWVVFSDPAISSEGQFVDGIVYWHGKNQQEAYRRSAKITGDAAKFYTGSIPYRRIELVDQDEESKKVA